MMKVDVRLSYHELMIGALAGVMRRVASMKENAETTDCNCPDPPSSWASDIDGALAEMAVSKYLGVYWSGHVRNFNGDDVLGGWQVRSNPRDRGRMVIRPRDKDNKVFVYVVANAPIYSIRGAIRAGDAKRDEWHDDGKAHNAAPCWFVPQSALKDLADFEEFGGPKR